MIFCMAFSEVREIQGRVRLLRVARPGLVALFTVALDARVSFRREYGICSIPLDAILRYGRSERSRRRTRKGSRDWAIMG